MFNKSSWKSVQFGDVVTNINSYFDRNNTGVYPYIAGPEITEGNLHATPSFAEVDEIPPTFKRIFLPNDVLYHSRNVEKLAVSEIKGITGEKLFVLRTKDSSCILQEYIPFMMMTNKFKQEIKSRLTGSCNKFLNWSALASTVCEIPPLDEQQRIAELLWAADEMIEAYDLIYNDLSSLKSKFVDTYFDSKPNKSKLSEHCINITTKYGKDESEENCVELKCLEPHTGKITYFVKKDKNASSYNVFSKGDVLFGKLRPYLRKYTLASQTGIACSEILVLRANQNIMPEYLYEIIQSNSFIEYNSHLSYGTKMPRTSWKLIADYECYVPSLDEQKAFVSKVNNISENMTLVKQQILGSKLLLNHLFEKIYGCASNV
ncbi:restriction endonuclease subunit S [Methanolobus profundi]|uniref:Type I restriction enzyme, S subunit n=1 Tax=Methanolobus profundi TaxID=487685 RepID=A0A1I4QJY3_9EURY|nr:restriction endonuclease subunit S [Methanolobus profundi]SFM40379.1 type I restriction enzyme, S subunit [Methanolobus profundi]